jgi:hypothetical protein
MTQEPVAQISEINLSPAMETRRQKNSRVNQCKKCYWEHERPSADMKKSLVWLCSSGPKGEMRG